MPEPRWVSVSEAARLEADAGRPVNKSSISRFLQANTDVPVQRDHGGRVDRVDYGKLVAARTASLAVQDRFSSRAEAPQVPRPPQGFAQQSATDRKRAADAERAELDLAERKGQVLSRDAAVSAIEAAGVTFVQALERRRRTLAQKLTAVADTRAVELELKSADRSLLETLVVDLHAAAQFAGSTALS